MLMLFFARYVGNDESSGEIGKVLGSAAAPLEEAKADVMGVWNMLYKVKRRFPIILKSPFMLAPKQQCPS